MSGKLFALTSELARGWVSKRTSREQSKNHIFSKILHIFPILLSRFGDKKIETCYLCCVDICKGKFTMCLFTSDTAAFGGGWNVGQSQAHIDLAASIPFPSINPTNPRTNAWNFGGNCSAFGSGWKTQLFWVGHLKNLFCTTKNFLLHSHEN